MLKKKPNLNWKNEDGLTPLFNATMSGSADFVEKLVKAGEGGMSSETCRRVPNRTWWPRSIFSHPTSG